MCYKRNWPILTSGLLVAVVMALLLACASSPEPGSEERNDGVSPVIFYYGLSSLAEQIAHADVIVKARLISVTPGTTRWNPRYHTGGPVWTGDDITQVGTIEHTFRVLEYLKGTGGRQIVAVVVEHSPFGKPTVEEARADGEALLAGRDNQWDRREAILFLKNTAGITVDFPQAGRYLMGNVMSDRGRLSDSYSIASLNDKLWLPSAAGALGGAGGRSGSTQRFLLDLPSSEGGASGSDNTRSSDQSDSSGSETITLAQLKKRIEDIAQIVAQGDGSTAYRECVYRKLKAAREVEDLLETRDQLAVYQAEEAMASGLPAGSVVHTGDSAYVIHHFGEDPNNDYGRFHLLDNDADLFTVKYPGEVSTVRPLTADDYRFFFNTEHAVYIPCDGQPEEYKRTYEVVLAVTAPAGTVHEAFFDPVSSGDAVGYFGTGGAIKPASFRTGDVNTTVQLLKWQDSAVTLGLQPYNALTGQVLDFITGDGTTTLSLQGAAATGDSTSGTLTWAVGSQPWSSGDELMLRLRESQTMPSFRRDSYTFSVPENTDAWESIGTVLATDLDGDAVLHKITSGSDGGRFAIDGWEGLILLLRELDYETRTSYELTITGTDPGGRSDSTTVTIEVTDVAE